MKITLAGLTEWLKTKPADETYRYTNPSECLIAQYGRSLGLDVDSVVPGTLTYRSPDGEERIENIDAKVEAVAVGAPYGTDINTYGEALSRALALVAA